MNTLFAVIFIIVGAAFAVFIVSTFLSGSDPFDFSRGAD